MASTYQHLARAAFLALALSGTALAGAGEYGLLVDRPGVEMVYDHCTACHSERIVAQQGLDRSGWDELLDWMEEEQGMTPLDTSDRKTVLDYLATHYNTDRPNFPN